MSAPWKKLRRRSATFLSFLIATCFHNTAHAKIDLVTLPSRDTTELTIYNSQDLTLVRETRSLSFNQGANEIQFSWANTLIDPTSLHIDVSQVPGLTVMDAIYPAGTNQLIVWNIDATQETSGKIEIRYFTSGLNWEADYIVKANQSETSLSLQQFTTIDNKSGEDFEEANTRVVVGEVNLVELIATLARTGIQISAKDLELGLAKMAMADEVRQEAMFESAPSSMPFGAMQRNAKEIIKKAVSEYYLFAIEGTETIENGWAKELPNPLVENIEFDMSYEIDSQKHGLLPVKFYKFKNSEESKLGTDPLPEGNYYVYADSPSGGLRFEGKTQHDYIPVGEDIELNLGADGLLLYEEKVMNFERSNFSFNSDGDVEGWDETREVTLELRNSRDRSIPVKLWKHFSGDWELDNVSRSDYEKVDLDTIKWEFNVPASSAFEITYELVTHLGTNATSGSVRR